MLGVLIWRAALTLVLDKNSSLLLRNFPLVFWPEADFAARIARQVFVAPVLETGGMLIVFVVLRWLLAWAKPGLSLPTAYLLVCGLLSWLLHGANLLSVGQGVGFMILASLGVRLMREWSMLTSFAFVALAHTVWNGLAMALYLSSEYLGRDSI